MSDIPIIPPNVDVTELWRIAWAMHDAIMDDTPHGGIRRIDAADELWKLEAHWRGLDVSNYPEEKK